MLRKTRNAAAVHIQDVQELVYVVTVFDTTGVIVNCQAACFHLMLKEHMIDLLNIFSEFGIRS
jgi:hypothetical protein